MTNIELRTKSIYSQLSKSEKKVADYFLANPQSVFDMPIASLAESAEVSKVTWVRFCKAIGYDGLKEMKRALYSEAHDYADAAVQKKKSREVAFKDIKDHTTIEQMVQTVQRAGIDAIENTFKLLDVQAVEKAACAIVKADNVKLFAVGASGLVADDLFSKLLRIGKSVCYSRDTHVQLTCAATLKPNDVAIFISYSGNTSEVLESLELARKNGACCVAITKFGKSELADKADYVLALTSPEIYHRSGAMSSRIAQLSVVDVLFTAVANKDYAKVEKLLESSYKSCAKHKMR